MVLSADSGFDDHHQIKSTLERSKVASGEAERRNGRRNVKVSVLLLLQFSLTSLWVAWWIGLFVSFHNIAVIMSNLP